MDQSRGIFPAKTVAAAMLAFSLGLAQAQDKPAKFWQAVNNQAYVGDFPKLTSPSSRLMDVSGHLGGPIRKDRLWIYTGAQYYRSQNRPTGFPEDVDYKQPRWFGKITAQATPTLNVMAALEVDTYNGLNRSPFGFNYPQLSPDTTVTQKSPEIVGNFSLTKILSQPFPKPEWVGEEVTGDPRYFNSNLVKKPYTKW